MTGSGTNPFFVIKSHPKSVGKRHRNGKEEGKVMKKFHFARSLIIGTALLLTACQRGSDGAGNGYEIPAESAGSSVEGEREWVYVPETAAIEDVEADYGNMKLVGGRFCCLTMAKDDEGGARKICQYSADGKELVKIPIEYQAQGDICEMGEYAFGQDFVWIVANVYASDYSNLKRFLCKFDLEGKNVISREITEQVGKDTSIIGLAADEQERIYIFTCDSGIYLYTGDGSFYGQIPYGFSGNVKIKGAANGNDGKFYTCVSKEENPDDTVLMEIDFEGRQFIEVADDFPDIRGFCAGTQPAGESGKEYDFLLYDNNAVYGYDLSASKDSGAGEELLCWLDSDINGYFVENFGETGDGRYYAIVEDWENDDRRAVLFQRTKAENVPKREDIALAAVNGNSALYAMAVNFNKGSSQYHLSIKNYGSLTDLYHAILAKEAIDIIDLSGVNVERLSHQGVFEDLSPYLEESGAFDRTDFLDGLLDVYTFDGKLVGIPESFTLRTVVGDRGRIGNDGGLSLERLLRVSGDIPGEQVFDGVTREEMMQYIMMFNEEAFIDWNTGECRFDSDLFKEVLEFTSRFPESIEDEAKEVSLPKKIKEGEVLFTVADFNELRSFQPYAWMYGSNAACIGFPTMDGSGGTLLFPNNAFGIAAGSANKSGAWEFMEGVLEREEPGFDEGWYFYYPSLQKKLNKMIDAQMERASQYDPDKFPALVFEDGTVIDYHALTWEEVNIIMEQLKEAKPFFDTEGNVAAGIINEEASGYYNGQKGAEETVSVIQNRVRLYVNENR